MMSIVCFNSSSIHYYQMLEGFLILKIYIELGGCSKALTGMKLKRVPCK